MSFVFKINEELAVIPVTAIELISITNSFNTIVKNGEFLSLYNAIIAEISQSYAVIDELISPFINLDTETKFTQFFEQIFQSFKERYLFDVSKPRRYCDNIYDDYIALQQTKESQSGFPILKRTFSRLDAFYDRWITNDNWLAMSIDNSIKLYNRHLSEISDINKIDPEYAYEIYRSANTDLFGYLDMIRKKHAQLQELVAPSLNTSQLSFQESI